MAPRHSWLIAGMFAALATLVVVGRPAPTAAQSPASLDDETLLSLVLPPQPDGSRPGVHLWARADQAVGPGGAPTVFVVTLLTVQGSSGPEEHEVVNYVQYSNGGWVPARPRDNGTLLIDDWAWISLNLTNLTASVSGQGDASRYTVDYTSSGMYNGSPRQLVIEEVYGADLSLVSSAIVSDMATAGTSDVAPSATPAATAASTVTGSPASPRTPASGTASVPASSTPSTTSTPAPSPVGAGGSNTIRPASPTP